MDLEGGDLLSRRSMSVLLALMLLSFILLTRYPNTPVPYSAIILQSNEQTGIGWNRIPSDQPLKEISISAVMTENELSKLRQMKQQFESAHPGVAIRILPASSEFKELDYLTAARLGDAPDIMLLDNAWVSHFAAHGYLRAMDAFYSADQQSVQQEQLIGQLKWNGYIWGVPKDLDPYVLVYRIDRLAEKGLQPPPWNGDALVSAHKALTSGADGKLGLWFKRSDPYAVLSLLWAVGAMPDSSAAPADAAARKANALKALETLQMQQMPANYPEAYAEAWEKLQQGQIAMMITPASAFKLNPIPGVAQVPLGVPEQASTSRERKSGGWLKGRSFVLSAKTAHAKEASQWILELTNRDAQAKLSEAGGVLPAMPGALEQITAVRAGLNSAQLLPADPQLPRRLDRLVETSAQLWSGKLQPVPFLERLQAIMTDK